MFRKPLSTTELTRARNPSRGRLPILLAEIVPDRSGRRKLGCPTLRIDVGLPSKDRCDLGLYHRRVPPAQATEIHRRRAVPLAIVVISFNAEGQGITGTRGYVRVAWYIRVIVGDSRHEAREL